MDKNDNRKDFLIKRDYKTWMPIKSEINNRQKFRTFSEWQVWWVAVGENVGSEINGKGAYYLRPAIVLKKSSKLSFLGIPLTTQAHEGYGFVKFMFKGKESYAVLNQLRTFSVFRLVRKKGELDDSDITLIRQRLKEFLNF
ncbi:type II toxin-antitoxin system PemK/MazF family toxin [Candidatus Saccharibacteria bacterium]|nr:type II toxin-antitoxin system PemK/MazF family toxin [Candidatus Saccharibacteria bacterium]